MKLLLLSLLLAGAGAGGYRLVRDEAPVAPAPCASSDCRVTVEPISPGTCLVTCYEADGSVRCQKEIACDSSCEKACDKPCAGESSAKSCPTTGSCQR